MGYRALGLIHSHIHQLHTRVTAEAGQGTVEYVALLFLVGAVFAAVVGAGKGKDFGLTQQITGTLKDTLKAVGK